MSRRSPNASRQAVLGYLARRVAWLIGSLFVAGSGVFFLLRVLPGDPAVTCGGRASPDRIGAIRHQLGTDRPLLTQYGHWLGDLVTGNLGTASLTQTPVLDQIAGRLPVTVPLALSAFVLSIVVALPIGVFAAVRRRGLLGLAVSALTQLGIALPIFWIGIVVVSAGRGPVAGAAAGRVPPAPAGRSRGPRSSRWSCRWSR